jgi:hypothetical protein
MMSGSTAQLYEEDFVQWTEEQAAALRQVARLGTNLPLDWENLAEEIDSLGRSARRELGSRIAVIIEHLIKLACSPAIDPRRGSVETVGRERRDIERLFDDSPSLKGETSAIIAQETPRVVRDITRTLRRYGEATPEIEGQITAISFTEDQVLGEWFPDDVPDAGAVPPVTSSPGEAR